MKEKSTEYDVGIIIGRFQVAKLHTAHIELFNHVIEKHTRVHVFLGVSPLPTSYKNPLPFEARRQMIETEFPSVRCYPLQDFKSDDRWVSNLDSLIKNIEITDSVTLYGGRESFINTYKSHHGKFNCIELVPDEYTNMFSGTVDRQDISKNIVNNEGFRSGIIWTNFHKFPTVYTTVDMMILNPKRTHVLLCKKFKDDTKWRFVGGFSDVSSGTFEQDAIREVKEETCLRFENVQYITNHKMRDWRYSDNYDGIKTLFFIGIGHGEPTPQDDIAVVKWFDVELFMRKNDLSNDSYVNVLIPEHMPLVENLSINKTFQEYIKKD